ncbi:MAG TPA: riboflavin synthase [Chthoniobacterales bacterium]|nr:riboflavin synthase [Chthoniobacterales bacterium]
MFTGLIEEVGKVIAVPADGEPKQLRIAAARIAAEAEIGASIAVNGCCLTVTSRHENELAFDLLEETLNRTNLKALVRESLVNLEQALPANGRLGGHFVQGHIDCTVPILALEEHGADLRMEVALPPEFAQYVVEKGSVAIDGISLTVAEAGLNSFAVWIIPHTRAQTNLASAKAGALVNLEFDLLAKYVERMLVRPA